MVNVKFMIKAKGMIRIRIKIIILKLRSGNVSLFFEMNKWL